MSDLGNNEFQIDDSDTKDKKTHRIVLGAATSVAGLAQNLLL